MQIALRDVRVRESLHQKPLGYYGYTTSDMHSRTSRAWSLSRARVRTRLRAEWPRPLLHTYVPRKHGQGHLRGIQVVVVHYASDISRSAVQLTANTEQNRRERASKQRPVQLRLAPLRPAHMHRLYLKSSVTDRSIRPSYAWLVCKPRTSYVHNAWHHNAWHCRGATSSTRRQHQLRLWAPRTSARHKQNSRRNATGRD